MRYSSHCRAIHAPPCYQASHTALSREANAFAAPAFPHEFSGTQNARKHIGGNRSASPGASAAPSSGSAWSVALAAMLVANLVVPPALATPMLPRVSGRQRDDEYAPGDSAPAASVGRTESPRDVEIQPINPPRIKTHYTTPEFLRALASANEPFRNLGKAVGDAYNVMTGDEVAQPTVQRTQQVGEVMDVATGLIPDVQLFRLPARLADVLADALEGNPRISTKITDILQFGDPRALGTGLPIRQESAPVQSFSDRRTPLREREPAPADDIDRRMPAEPHGGEPQPQSPGEAPAEEGQEFSAAQAPASNVAAAEQTLPIIEGEREHLHGYAQTLSPEQIPSAPTRQMMTVDGRHYLAGESGYYHVTPGLDTDHWLVNAPRGAGAQVPVTYDAQTGAWRADAPLRLCGGGCASSREVAPDSVAMSENDVGDAIRHITDRDVRYAIQQAYNDLAYLQLLRANREDLRRLQDFSIVEHRHELVPKFMRLHPYMTLFEQQREAAALTATYYQDHAQGSPVPLALRPEAYCQENAAILFHYLLSRGVPGDRIRMITARTKGVSEHVMVLYSESAPFIELLDSTTPQPPLDGYRDGISGDTFAGALFLTRDSTVLLDPWSRIKASSFPEAANIGEVSQRLDIALADMGRLPGRPFSVSLTRPSPTRRERATP